MGHFFNAHGLSNFAENETMPGGSRIRLGCNSLYHHRDDSFRPRRSPHVFSWRLEDICVSEDRKLAPSSTWGVRLLRSAPSDNLRQFVNYVCGLISRDHVLSLADQAIVSGTSFLTTLMIARYSNIGQLGVYAVGISILVSLVAFQDSLILQPYTIQQHSSHGTAAEHLGSSLALSILFSIGSVLVLTIAAMGFLKWAAHPELIVMTWAIAAIAPFALTREFARRVAFARLEISRALLLDSLVAVIQLSVLGWLGASGHMSALTACAALGVASAIALAIWLVCVRTEIVVRARHVRIIFRQTWALGKWLFVGRITVQVQGYVTYWIAMLVSGASVTGLYAACMSIVNFINPALFALGNVLTAKLSLAWKRDGAPGLWQEAIRNTVLISTLMAAFCLAVIVGGSNVMHFLYHDPEYDGYGTTLTLLALSVSVGAVGTPASFGLATMGRPRAIVVVGIIGAIVSVVLVTILMMEWGLLGAAYGLLAGSVVGTVGRWMAFSALIPPACDAALVVRVLQNLTTASDPSRWIVSWVGGGEQSEVFKIESKDRTPICFAYNSLVAKLYKPEAALTFEMVQAQYDSLSKLHTVLHGREINGWTISVPHPLYICKAPLAFVMTAVPGQFIDSCVSEGDVLTSEVLQDAAHVFAIAMQQCWSSGQRHGDLGLRNVLFDIEAKRISFIDAGTRESCQACSDLLKFPCAVSADLAHILCDVAKDVTDLIGSPARMGREIFVETIFRKILEDISTQEKKQQLLKEIRGCLQAHLAEYLELSWSLKGVSHRVLKEITEGRVRSILKRVVSECDPVAEQPKIHRVTQIG